MHSSQTNKIKKTHCEKMGFNTFNRLGLFSFRFNLNPFGLSVTSILAGKCSSGSAATMKKFKKKNTVNTMAGVKKIHGRCCGSPSPNIKPSTWKAKNNPNAMTTPNKPLTTPLSVMAYQLTPSLQIEVALPRFINQYGVSPP